MRIKITEEQYKKILLSEEKKRLTENLSDFELGLLITSLAGKEFTGHNKVMLDDLKGKAETIMPIVKSTLENKDKLKNVINALDEKGMKNIEEFLANNRTKIKNNFNELANGINLDSYTEKTLKELNSK